MDRIKIRGGRPLEGEIAISGAKNAALPLMAASLLTEEPLSLSNLPHLADITTLAHVLSEHGVDLHMEDGAAGAGEAHAGDAGAGDARPGHAGAGPSGRVLSLTAGRVINVRAAYDLVRKMRASVLVLGPLLAREGYAEVSLPGGCAIGTRPVDLHLRAMEQLGAEIELKDGYIEARAPGGLAGGEVVFPKVSVGATENALMAATLARGTSRIVNAAREPEIGDLADCLNKMGAKISGIGSDTLVVEGVDRLSGAHHAVIPDRIETGTYAMAAAITGGELDLVGGESVHLRAALDKLGQAGVAWRETDRGLRVGRANGPLAGVDAQTEPYPGFPTDLQAQFIALMATARGAAMVTETIFENRFMHVPELIRMGADIQIDGASALVRGVDRLKGAPVMATDLRASVSLVLAGLAAEGETEINRVYHLDRGYERLEEKLGACGAEIARSRREDAA